jgi:AcrR family transcriptional regulator
LSYERRGNITEQTRRERERKNHEREIVDAAEKLFCEKGFDATSMDEIAKAAQFTKRTLYQYFENKEDLYYAATLLSFQMLHRYVNDAVRQSGSGMDRLRQGGDGYYQFYRDHPGKLRLIGELGQIKKRFGGSGERLAAILAIDNGLFQSMKTTIDEGIADGSIRADVDSLQTTFSIIFLLTGFFNQMAATGNTFLNHFSLDAGAFCSQTLTLLFSSLTPTHKV